MRLPRTPFVPKESDKNRGFPFFCFVVVVVVVVVVVFKRDRLLGKEWSFFVPQCLVTTLSRRRH